MNQNIDVSKMRIIDVNTLQPNMIFDKPLYMENGSKICAENTPLKADDLERLKKWGINKVLTDGNIISGNLLKDEEKKEEEKLTIREKLQKKQEEKEKLEEQIRKKLEEHQNIFKEPTSSEKRKLINLYDSSIPEIEKILTQVHLGQKISKDFVYSLVDKFVLNVPKYSNFFLNLVQGKSTEEYLLAHSLNTMILNIIIGHCLKYTSTQLRTLALGGLFHDVGMFKIPKHIREKERALTDSDIKLIKAHTVHSYRLILAISDFDPAVALCGFQHHENWNGTGYPQKLAGDKIHIFARITAVSQAYSAMIKKRAYRSEKISHNVMKEILKGTEKNFDPAIVKIFLDTMAIFPIGSVLQLSNGKIGIVVAANPGSPLQPVVKIIFDEQRKRLQIPEIIDLKNEPNIKIEKIFDPKQLGISVVDEI